MTQTKLEFLHMVVDRLQTAVNNGEVFCTEQTHSYVFRYEDFSDQVLYDVRWHINKKDGFLTNGYIYINGKLQTLSVPVLVLALEKISVPLIVMEKMTA